MEYVGKYDDPEFAKLVMAKTRVAFLTNKLIPDEIDEELTGSKLKDAEDEAKEAQETLEDMESKLAVLKVPVVIDRSSDEKTKVAKAEWIKVYGAIYGKQAAAKTQFDKYAKKAAKK